MACPQSLNALESIRNDVKRIRAIVSPDAFLCSSLGTASPKKFIADDAPNMIAFVSRITVICQSLGTNTYIALGTRERRRIRLTSLRDSYTYIAPIVNGTVLPFRLEDFYAQGDNAANDGVIEIQADIVSLYDEDTGQRI